VNIPFKIEIINQITILNHKTSTILLNSAIKCILTCHITFFNNITGLQIQQKKLIFVMLL